MIIRWRRTEDQIEGRICECQTTAQQIMSDPANRGFVFNCRGFDDVFMQELPPEGMQKPSTDGPVASSTRPTREPQSFHQDFGNVHKSGTQKNLIQKD